MSMSKNEFSYFNELLDVLADKVDPSNDDLIQTNNDGVYLKVSDLFPYSAAATVGHDNVLLSFEREGFFAFPVFSHIDEDSNKIECYSEELTLSESTAAELDNYTKLFANAVDKFTKLETKLVKQAKERHIFINELLQLLREFVKGKH